MIYYSKSTNAFYDDEIHGNLMPEDVIEISKELHVSLLSGQEAGKQISSDNDGNPILIDRVYVELNYAQKRAQEYPTIADQLDLLYHDIKAGNLENGNWIAAIETVKQQFPKE
jgi:hypothetical protein